MVKQSRLRPLTAALGIHRGRVVAKHDYLDPLKAHHAIGFGPTPVVADTHAHYTAMGASDIEAQITGQEIPLFQVLKGPLRVKFRVSGKMYLAVF